MRIRHKADDLSGSSPPMKNSCLNDSVQKKFERAAESYDKHFDFQKNVADDLISNLIYVLSSVKNILDVGCGRNYISKSIQERGCKGDLFGLDFSYLMLKASQADGSMLLSNKYLIQGDAHQLPFLDNSFELVVSSTAIHWCQLDVVLREIGRVLRPHGLFKAAFVERNTYPELRAVLRKRFQITEKDLETLMPTFLEKYSVDKIFDNFEGLEYKARLVEYVDYYSGFIEILRDLKGTGTNISLLKGYQGLGGRKFAREIDALYRDMYPCADGLRVTRNIIFVDAIKLNQP